MSRNIDQVYTANPITSNASTDTYTVGAAGSGGSSGANNGASGGTTSFGRSLQATGGGGGFGPPIAVPFTEPLTLLQGKPRPMLALLCGL